MKEIFLLGILVWSATADVSHLKIPATSTPPPPPKPYAFGYAAGRFPGHIDRTHSEVSDGSGVVKGSYSYVDPKFQIRTVDYVADKDGFYPILNKTPPPLPRDSAAVAAAKNRHYQLYARIADAHQSGVGRVVVPVDSVAVQKAKSRHQDLYQKIAEEHARIAAEREALKLIEEAAAEKNSLHY